ncbi:MAG TPA: DUF885 family protein, partial [Rhodanobacteraceae bacterium]|nr:DUF885 family protein [Rhodanobacteraceae bacterium]
MDRRSFLATGATIALLPFTEAPSFAAATASGDAKLNALFEEIFEERIRTSPGFATALGLDKGKNARLRSTFDPKPFQQARAEDVARNRKALAAVRAISPSTLSPPAALNREIVIYDLERNLLAPTRFDLDSVQSPYLISQQDGNYFGIPDFLNSQHPIETAPDAEAYLSRLSEFGKLLDYETAEQKRMAARGFLAPGWSLDLALGQMAKLRAPAPAESGMVKSVADRAAKKGIAGDWAARATRIVERDVYPALDRQIAAIRALRPTTRAGDGAGRLQNGAEIYAAALEQATTTTMSPEEVHQLGLSQVAEYTGLLDN